MSINQFSIIHELPETQFLVDTTFNHDTYEFELSMKFWCKAMNGFATMTLRWPPSKESDYRRTFKEFKDVEKAKKWIAGFEQKLLTSQ
ncbi:hypothetical protein [Mucilaginibacter sp. 10I4]|uniref:hypothetical protein n=1 Tax=Mucilaginibacter sp. 10I4 TaxID=3048580 RepID=UPI002B23C3CF|nr:hypothetical protein [Mucilaginibacter sp. 10I4]MEB0262873.1 hypothetical protein [Mucilaginibacter sp. 10I4]